MENESRPPGALRRIPPALLTRPGRAGPESLSLEAHRPRQKWHADRLRWQKEGRPGYGMGVPGSGGAKPAVATVISPLSAWLPPSSLKRKGYPLYSSPTSTRLPGSSPVNWFP